ncbi:DUF1772 domain-containing protein [Cryobacterium sp. PAMC25264]|uniref:DUF1772 domain-containing protein n=1 Tax=Cryobacterium sp. PAMC25264 TaxID=2861288 RepID=UPI001C624D3F|nr:DUF1772 domain-containing protein [Cryobacterium sp. PAMC25264]QYF72725.1 DUF1772 domain-containing protein [Cryobacterium sp. PAMC25264]
MTSLAHVSALLAIMGVSVVYGTDVFCALVLRPALAQVDDSALSTVMGAVHRYGDRRMPVPGAVGLVASAAATVLAAIGDNVVAACAAGVALALLVVWMVLYVRASAPINRAFTAAADARVIPTNARALQAGWDRIITLRSTLQGLAVLALGVSLLVG